MEKVFLFSIFINLALLIAGKPLNDCYNLFVAQYFKNKTLFIIDMDSNSEIINKNILDENRTVLYYKYKQVVLNMSKQWKDQCTSTNNILIFLNVENNAKRSFLKFLSCWNEKTKILIVLNENNSVSERILKFMFTETNSLNVVTLEFRNNCQFKTFFPYECSDNQMKKILIENEQPFPIKIPKKFGCSSLNVALEPRVPFCTLHDINVEHCGLGFEYTTIKTIFDFYNLSFKEVAINHFYDDLFPNGSFNGALKLIYEKQVDLAFGGYFLSTRRSHYADILPVFIFDQVGWFLKRPELVKKWKNIVLPFSSRVWLAIFIFVFFIAAALSLTAKLRGNKSNTFKNALFISLSILFKQYSYKTFTHQNSVISFVITSAMFYALILTTGYESAIMKLYTITKYQQKYKTLKELVDNDYQFIIWDFYLDAMLEEKSSWWRKVTDKSRSWISNLNYTIDMVQVDTGSKVAALIDYSAFEFLINLYYFDEKGKPTLYFLDEPYVDNMLVQYITKYHPLRDLLHTKSRQIFEAGLTHYWKESLNERCRNIPYVPSDNPQLSLHEVYGIFYVWLICLCCAILVFTMEVLWIRILKRMKTIFTDIG